MIEQARNRQPRTVNVSWKTKHGRVINLAFGASITALNWDDRKKLCEIRQKNDRYLFPRDLHGNVIPKIKVWEFGNCSETNAWTYLCRWMPDLEIKSQTISVHRRIIMDP